jgi:hypothetical protein
MFMIEIIINFAIEVYHEDDFWSLNISLTVWKDYIVSSKYIIVLCVVGLCNTRLTDWL